MARSGNNKKNFLVALLKNKSDLNYVLEDHWYRIPVRTKLVPVMVKENYIKYIAFYHNRFFNQEPSLIKYHSRVNKIEIVPKRNIFPWLENDERGDQRYYLLHLNDIECLERPIVSKRRRRILFITTTLAKFNKAREINDLFNESYLENKLWKTLRKELIEAERQYYINISGKNYLLDFALFCRERNINIECDGDEYHLRLEHVKYDKVRDNDLASKGWSILRYDFDQLSHNPKKVIMQIKETINSYGGLEISSKPFKYKYFDKSGNQVELD